MAWFKIELIGNYILTVALVPVSPVIVQVYVVKELMVVTSGITDIEKQSQKNNRDKNTIITLKPLLRVLSIEFF